MTWTQECIQSNTFKVKNLSDVIVLFRNMGFCVYQEQDRITIIGSEDGADTDFEDIQVVLLKNGTVKSTWQGVDYQTTLLGYVNPNRDIGVSDILYETNKIYPDLNVSADDVEVVEFIPYIQRELLEGERFVITTAGFEGRTSGTFNPYGSVEIITKGEHAYHSLYELALDKSC